MLLGVDQHLERIAHLDTQPQAVGRAGGAMRDPAGDQQQLAGLGA